MKRDKLRGRGLRCLNPLWCGRAKVECKERQALGGRSVARSHSAGRRRQAAGDGSAATLIILGGRGLGRGRAVAGRGGAKGSEGGRVAGEQGGRRQGPARPMQPREERVDKRGQEWTKSGTYLLMVAFGWARRCGGEMGWAESV
ncbi:hypothetical protein BS50DRAFT_333916 [Corynespora cassiicola Philippines]|uniref:Uncharacterized protein n=1 Tax=Corynespora cassiicola Philippines TaxID=1448308 RepID=A0A2T2NUN7_CORCC|nr:hypothetical protein BS50DRAFT_333916 [Corynespora cassiicola Philippines]